MALLQIIAAVACLIQPPTPGTESPLVGPGRSLPPVSTPHPTQSPEPTPASEISPTSEPEHPAATPEPSSLAVETPEPTAPARAPESSDLPPKSAVHATPLAPASEEFSRDSGFIDVSAGITNCSQPDCYDIVMAGLGRLEFGYRFGVPALVLSTSVGGAPLSPPPELAELRSRAVFVDVGGGVQISPVRKGRVDPFMGAKLGYTRMAWSYTNGDIKATAWYSRGFVGFTTGLNIFVTKFVAIGPRFDYLIPFAGKLCSKDPTMESCTPVKDFVDQGQDTYEKRAIWRALAQPWSVTVNLAFMVGSM